MHACMCVCALYGDEKVYQSFPGTWNKIKEIVKLFPGKQIALVQAVRLSKQFCYYFYPFIPEDY